MQNIALLGSIILGSEAKMLENLIEVKMSNETSDGFMSNKKLALGIDVVGTLD